MVLAAFYSFSAVNAKKTKIRHAMIQSSKHNVGNGHPEGQAFKQG